MMIEKLPLVAFPLVGSPLVGSPLVGSSQVAGAAAISGANAGKAAAASPSDFSAMMSEMIAGSAAVLKAGEATSIAGIRGDASVQQVAEAVMAAEQTLQTGIAIRDKVVAAYLELSRMAI